MSKSKSAFFCTNCGYESAKWAGKCPACNEWNGFTEEVIDKGKGNAATWEDYAVTQKGPKLLPSMKSKVNQKKELTAQIQN
jgi:DNA repair protein RadA/Sms